MNNINDQLELPRIMQSQTQRQQREHPEDVYQGDLGNIPLRDWEFNPKHMAAKVLFRDRWAERLWPFMAWFIALFNMFMASAFCVRVIFSETPQSDVHYVMLVATMCGTYLALIWTHHNVLRKKDGLE